jgi:uncharacterized protein YcbX
MRVTEVHVYPVKSCRGIALRSSRVGRRGLEHDRRWMIVDDTNTFITQREVPMLARVDVAVDAGTLVLSADGHGQVQVDASQTAAGVRRRVRVWSSEVDALDCGDEAARWLGGLVGSAVGAAVRLVFMPDDVERAVSPEHARPGDIVGFADGFPILLATTASLEDLNARLAAPVPMNRFRPNVVVEGCSPWEEDGWTRVTVGEVRFRVAKPCGRCTIVTTDQRTGERGPEPLRTLATFRQQDSKVNFAQNCVPDADGTIAVGDEVRVLSPAKPS